MLAHMECCLDLVTHFKIVIKTFSINLNENLCDLLWCKLVIFDNYVTQHIYYTFRTCVAYLPLCRYRLACRTRVITRRQGRRQAPAAAPSSSSRPCWRHNKSASTRWRSLMWMYEFIISHLPIWISHRQNSQTSIRLHYLTPLFRGWIFKNYYFVLFSKITTSCSPSLRNSSTKLMYFLLEVNNFFWRDFVYQWLNK